MPKRNGLWLNENTFMDFAEVDRQPSLSKEIATRQASIDFYSLGMSLPDPDPVLRKRGEDMKIYRELLVDDHVWACYQSRQAGVTKLNWALDRGKAKSRVSKFYQQIYDRLDVWKIIGEILNAPFWGIQPLEVMWGQDGEATVPLDVVGKPPEWFCFSETNELLFKNKEVPDGVAVSPKKFLCPAYKADYQNPYGQRALSRCFWPVTFKKGGLKFWVTFAEKYGMPFAIGKHPRGTPKEETDALLTQLANMIQDACAVIPDDSSVELIEAAGRGASGNLYNSLIDACNASISKATIGQTLTTEIGDKGSYAASQTHGEVRQDLVDADKKMVEDTFNQLNKWIGEINGMEPPAFTMWEEEDVDLDLATRDKTLTEAGVKFTKVYFQKKYGLEEEDFEVGAPQTPSPGPLPAGREGEFSDVGARRAVPFPDQQALDDAVDNISPEELQNQMEGILKPVIDLIQAGNNPEEIMAQLAEAYPDMESQALEEMLTRAIFVSELWGRLNAAKSQ